MNRYSLFVMAFVTGALLAGAGSSAAQSGAAVPAQPPPASAAAGGSQSPPPADQPATTSGATPPAGEATLKQTPGAKALGISILGNQEAPTSLVIVPWKTSELGQTVGVSTVLDDSKQPVDRDVFMRSLRYHEISVGTVRPDGAKTGGRDRAAADSNAAQSATAPPRRK